MLSYDFSDDHATAYALGIKQFTGIAITIERGVFYFNLHLNYEDRQLAKNFGCKWAEYHKVWFRTFSNLGECAKMMLEILENEALSNALSIYTGGESIPCYVEDKITPRGSLKDLIIKCYLEKRSNLSDREKTTEQVIIVDPEPKKLPSEWKIGLMMSSEGITGFSVKMPYSEWHIHTLKKICNWADGKPKWYPDKKLWKMPLTVANLLNDPQFSNSRDLKDFFENFEFTEGAKPYFTSLIKN